MCGRNNTVKDERLRVMSGSLSGDRGRTAAAAEAPGVIPATRLQGLSQSSPSGISQTDEGAIHESW
jgi:hypothetical protein